MPKLSAERRKELQQLAYSLIDQLGPGQLDAVVRLLETIVYDEDEELTGAGSAGPSRFARALPAESRRRRPLRTGGWRSRLHHGPSPWPQSVKKIRFAPNVPAEIRAIEQRAALGFGGRCTVTPKPAMAA